MIAAMLSVSLITANAEVIVSDGDYSYTYTSGAWELYAYNGTDAEITLPGTFNGSQVRTVGDRCFASSNLESVTIPNGYTSIGEFAFFESEKLSEVKIPASVNEIGVGAFSKTGIESLDLSATKLSHINTFLCDGCASLKSVLMPESVKTIGESAFSSSGITSIKIPGKVTSLAPRTFSNTAALKSIELPQELVSIGESCFEGSGISEINLPEGLTAIGVSAFRNAGSLAELYIPNSVESIGGYALYPMSVQSKIHVTCFKNSYADEYCYENFVQNTTAYDYLVGDANLSGAVDISDVTLIQKYKAGLRNLDNPCAKILCDANADDEISVRDATIIQMYLADIIRELPV